MIVSIIRTHEFLVKMLYLKMFITKIKTCYSVVGIL